VTNAQAATSALQAAIAQENAHHNTNLMLRQPYRELAPGIFWERTGPREHRVTIRRRAEVVIDLSGLGENQ